MPVSSGDHPCGSDPKREPVTLRSNGGQSAEGRGRLLCSERTALPLLTDVDWLFDPAMTRLYDKQVGECAAPAAQVGANPASSLRFSHMLPPRSMAGQLTLDQHIGVRIPGGQPR